MRKVILLTSVLCALSLGSHDVSAQVLTPLTTFGPHGDGTLLPGDVPFLTSDGNRYQRGMAFNPVTGHLIIVNRFPLGSETINVIDAMTGTNITELDQSSRATGGSTSFVYNQIAISDDGAIYVGNLSTSGTDVQFNLYRWTDENSPQQLVYFGNPGNTTVGGSRWGDTLTVRGSGMNTDILLATQNGTLAAILRPGNPDLTTFNGFTNAPVNASVSAGGLGYGLAFSSSNTFYGKASSAAGNPLYLMTYDLNAGTASVLFNYGNLFPGTSSALSALLTSNWLACIADQNSTSPHKLRLFDISNRTNAPTLLDRVSVPSWTNANSVYAGATAFGFGTNLYALDSDNGIAAFSIVAGTHTLPPNLFGQPQGTTAQITSNAVFSVGADGTVPLSFFWRFSPDNIAAATNLPGATNSILTLTNLTTSNAGYYSAIVTNAYGSVTSSPALLSVLPNFGNLLIYEPFAYPPGTALPGQGTWTVTSTATNGAVEAGNLTVPGLLPSFGNRYTWTNSSSVRVTFGQYSAGEVFCSFAFRLDTASSSTANETTAGFSFGTSTTFPLKINIIGDGAGGYQFGLYKGGGTTGNGSIDTNHTFHAGDTVFLVAHYAFHAGTGQDTCDLWINPDPTTFGSNAPPAATLANIGVGVAQSWSFIDRFFWRWASAGYTKRVSDELRVGFAWAEVTPPVPPSLSILQNGANVVLSWPIYNSSGYQLQSNPRVDDSGGWENVGGTVVPQNGTNNVTVSASSKKLFYRLAK